MTIISAHKDIPANKEPISLTIQTPAVLDYRTAWERQRKLQAALIAGSNCEHFIFCEHTPVLTYGSSTELSKVLLSEASVLEYEGIHLVKSDRGGNITYHGPGQLICYIIIDLKKRRQDVSWYLRSIEKVIIELLSLYKIDSFVIPSQTGVWVSDTDKICAMGIRISRWCTMHGFALNLGQSSESGFRQIIPCGISGSRATSIESITGYNPEKSEIIQRASGLLLKHFYEDFGLAYSTNYCAAES